MPRATTPRNRATAVPFRRRRRRVRRRASSISASGSSGASGVTSGGGLITDIESRDDATIDITMLEFAVNRDDPTPLHDQVAAKIRRAIADGEALPGDRLPPAKDLASVLAVNSNTVLRALRQLRDEGLLEFRRGRGISVAGTPERGAVVARAQELVRFARLHGYEREELIRIIESTG